MELTDKPAATGNPNSRDDSMRHEFDIGPRLTGLSVWLSIVVFFMFSGLHMVCK